MVKQWVCLVLLLAYLGSEVFMLLCFELPAYGAMIVVAKIVVLFVVIALGLSYDARRNRKKPP